VIEAGVGTTEIPVIVAVEGVPVTVIVAEPVTFVNPV
jgi:hypothetical protein